MLTIRQKLAVTAVLLACAMEIARVLLTANLGETQVVHTGLIHLLAYVPDTIIEAQPWESTAWAAVKWALGIGGVLALVPADRWVRLRIALRR